MKRAKQVAKGLSTPIVPKSKGCIAPARCGIVLGMSSGTDEPRSVLEVPEAFAPPYTAFETFKNQFVRMRDNPVPPRIDRSLFVGMAGGTQSQILSSLRSFDLIGEHGEVSEAYVSMAASEDELVAGMAHLVRTFYREQVKLAVEKATAAQLEESFRSYGYSGSTLRKAVSFYLNISKFAGVPLSPYFRAPTPRSAPKKRLATRTPLAPEPMQTTIISPAAGDSFSVTLRSGGEVALSCSVNLFALDGDDRAFVFDLIDRLRGYPVAAESRGHLGGSGQDNGDEA